MGAGSAFGHHGHETKIKLTALDFAQCDYTYDYYYQIDADGGALDLAGGGVLLAAVLIPRGMKATHVYVYAETTDADGVNVYVGDIDDGDVAQQLTGGSTNVEEALDAEVDHTDTNYLVVTASINANDIYGGYVLIAPI